MATLYDAVEKAARPEDIFGTLPGTKDEQLRVLKTRFHHKAEQLHPDKHGGSKRAESAFARLSALHDEAESRVQEGIYGTVKTTPKPSIAPTILTHKKRQYVVTGLLVEGEVCSLHRAVYNDTGLDYDVVVKVSRATVDNDLVENEATLLTKLVPPGALDEKYYRYLSRVMASFKIAGTGGPRQVNVLPFYQGYYSFQQIQAAYPGGIPFEDAVWMLNRMLEGLGFVHTNGNVIHGAVVPPHLLVHPKNHAVRLIDWCYAVKAGGSIKAISPFFQDLYPPEVLKKQPARSATDIYMVAKCIQYLAASGWDAYPAYFKRFIEGCLFASPIKRPDDAWKLRDEFEELMKKHYGPRRYHKFTMPD